MNTLRFTSILCSATLYSIAAQAEVVHFDDAKSGRLAPGWVAGLTGKGNPKWSVERDDSAPSKPNVLKQSGQGTYPWCVKKDVALRDGYVEVKFKPISGEEDQAAGLIWRWQDGDNYYVARANAIGENITIYHTLKGKRKEFKRVGAKVAANEWHRLRVTFKGSHFTVALNGKKVMEWEDETFKESGAVGVWTKADSVTLFDDFEFGAE
ncbi:MAG: DUF1080 domain-containing protein [Verrucomicrobia bacterium]|nr:DUF1080 domain-containing protein [Verrucomicrobiota bacterium]